MNGINENVFNIFNMILYFGSIIFACFSRIGFCKSNKLGWSCIVLSVISMILLSYNIWITITRNFYY